MDSLSEPWTGKLRQNLSITICFHYLYLLCNSIIIIRQVQPVSYLWYTDLKFSTKVSLNLESDCEVENAI